MNNSPDLTSGSIPGSISGAAESRPFSAGGALREAREKLGLSVLDVSNRLKFAPRQIEALEADDYARLPEIAFVRGFMRSYAKLLQMDSTPLLAALPQPQVPPASTIEPVELAVSFPSGRGMGKRNLVWIAASLLVVIALGLFTGLHDSKLEVAQIEVETLELPPVVVQPESAVAVVVEALPSPSPSSSPSSSPSISPPSSVTAPRAKPISAISDDAIDHRNALIHLVFDDESWVEVADKDGKSLLAQLNLRGSEKRINGTPPLSLVIGNASGVRLYYQGKRVDLAPYNRAEVAHLTLE